MTDAGSLTLTGGVAILALLAAGCLEATPPPVKAHDGGGYVPPPMPDGGGDAETTDAETTDAESNDAESNDMGADAGAALDAGAAAWAGTWKFVSGSQGIACGGSIAVTAVSGFLDITPSSSGTLLSVVEDGCIFHFDLVGAVATSEPGQACSAWAIPTIPTWTLTMQPDGTLREMLGGRLVVSGEICTISGGAKLARQ